MKKRFLFCLLATPILASAGGRIVGGTTAEQGSWPWMVSVQNPYKGNHYDGHLCGGSLIAENWVITAAHCMAGRKPEDISILAGVYDLTAAGGQTRQVHRIVVHPEYNSITQDSDVAMIQLETPVEKLALIPLISGTSGLAGSLATTLGWGSMEPDGTANPSKLQEVQLPIVSNRECNRAFEQEYSVGNSVSKNMLCAGYTDENKDACFGDSGGPLMVRQRGNWVLAGLVSWGLGDCASSYGVYTRVSRFAGFVHEKISFDYFAAADVDHNGKVNKSDKIAKRNEINADIEDYLNQCWLPAAECGDITGDSLVDWLDLEKQAGDAEYEYQTWLADIWELERGQ